MKLFSLKKTKTVVATSSVPERPKTWGTYCINNQTVTFTRIEFRPFYDSTWLIEVTDSKSTISCKVVFDDDTTIGDIIEIYLANKPKTVEDIKKMDRRSKIFYD